ncbi:MAG: hypothetical protein NT031_08070, partial [Planctomycetota bacterium]|nr:hypothetical protein [Planctomycetota bacterium]
IINVIDFDMPLQGAIEAPLADRAGGRIFGCDACQDACPQNRTILPGDEELTAEYWQGLGRAGPLGGAGAREILRWTVAEWSAATEGSAIRRASLEQLQRNAALGAGGAGGRQNRSSPADTPADG